MRAYFAGSGVPTPEEMGKMLAPSAERAAAARKLRDTLIGDKPEARLKKKSVLPGKKVAPAIGK